MLPARSWDAPYLLRSRLLCRSLQQRRRSSRTKGTNVVTVRQPDKPRLWPESHAATKRKCVQLLPKASANGRALMHRHYTSFFTSANVAPHTLLDGHRTMRKRGSSMISAERLTDPALDASTQSVEGTFQ
jgi:hypothetical protein